MNKEVKKLLELLEIQAYPKIDMWPGVGAAYNIDDHYIMYDPQIEDLDFSLLHEIGHSLMSDYRRKQLQRNKILMGNVIVGQHDNQLVYQEEVAAWTFAINMYENMGPYTREELIETAKEYLETYINRYDELPKPDTIRAGKRLGSKRIRILLETLERKVKQ